MTNTAATSAPADTGRITSKLSLLDRYLAVWILGAMALGLGLGHLVPALGGALDSVKVAGVSLPMRFDPTVTAETAVSADAGGGFGFVRGCGWRAVLPPVMRNCGGSDRSKSPYTFCTASSAEPQ